MPRACACSLLFLQISQGVSQMKTKYMKNNWMHFTLALGLMGAMATAVHAESFSAEVPFAFEAAGKSFPAGVYTVEPLFGRRHYDPQCGFRRNGGDDGLTHGSRGDPQARY